MPTNAPRWLHAMLWILPITCSCGSSSDSPSTSDPGDSQDTPVPTVADVIDVTTSGEPGNFRLSVTVASPDTGCDQYADWWEVVSEEGELMYRRVLLHSHVTEQPFERSGGPVESEAEQPVWVRAHMNVTGYGGQALHGSVSAGFVAQTPAAGFAQDLATQGPLPDDCDF